MLDGSVSHALTFDNQIAHVIVERQGMTPGGTNSMPQKPDLLQGTLDLLVLKALAHGALHGWAISKRIQQMSREALTVTQGSLYPALYRLEDRGWIVGDDAQSPEGRRIKVYRLTAVGRKQLADEVEAWRAFSTAINRVVRAT
jgi:PadR family transcriptional regulator, regulatory protein PadR